jgi:hypothetical protein
MKDFEAFDIGSWVREGLTEHVKVSAIRVRKHSKSISVPVQFVAAAAVAVCTIATPWLSMQAQSPVTALISPSELRTADVISGPPQWFWSRMADQMNTWKPAIDSVDSEIPPFI